LTVQTSIATPSKPGTSFIPCATSFYFQGRSDSGLQSVGWGALEALDLFTAAGGGATYAAVSLDPASVLEHPMTTGVVSLSSQL
jgi:hypothetical protein